VASDLLASLELYHVEALHDLVMVQFAESGAVNDDVSVGLAKSADN
jgi:hypothetical protein